MHEPPGTADRYEREREFHDERFATRGRSRTARFYRDTAGRARYREQLDALARDRDVLEIGCGPGSAAVRLAPTARHVLAIDLSPVAIRRARKRARRQGRPENVEFAVMNVEALDLPDASIDLVCASGVLHHLDYERTYTELARVLRDDGEVLFLEPLAHNPLIEWYRRRTPHERSEDEHPLRTEDVEIARRWFHDVDAEFHDLTALAAAFVPPSWARHVAPPLQRFDDWLFRRVPRLRRYAWVVVLRAGRPRRTDVAVTVDLTAAETTETTAATAATAVSLAGEELVDQLDERGPVGVDRRVADEAHRTP